MNKKSLVITPGDPQGIGPEVTALALFKLKNRLKKFEVVIFGSSKPFKRFKKELSGLPLTFFEPPAKSSPGYQSGWSIETATQFVMASPKTRILVTGPISKERLQASGYKFNGHTDFLAKITQVHDVTMLLANEQIKTVLVTDHCPINQVSKNLTPAHLFRTFLHAEKFAREFEGKKKPKIAVLGLNPHAGENGILGDEEVQVIIPAMKAFQKKFPSVRMSGPHPSDSFFAVEKNLPAKDRHDVVVAMYHDQGLIPVKLTDFSNALNLTLGLPFIRTSVDHGTAFSIAGKGKADPGSMIYAIKKGIDYSEHFYEN